MNKITETLMRIISENDGELKGAYSIREDGGCAAVQSTDNIKIEAKEDKPGIDIRVAAGTKGETVSIPACVTRGGIDDLVYNDFYVGENADITIVAGCGVHTDDHSDARHNGIHRFFLSKGAKVLYTEKHVGTGDGDGKKSIDPVTEIFMDEDSMLEMDTVQIRGVDHSVRKTKATLAARAKLVVRERLMTDGEEFVQTDFDVIIEGEDAAADVVSRSVARGKSRQVFNSLINGKTRCTGHSECDAILAEEGNVVASPSLEASHIDAALIHEAAIGKIAGEQILKLRTLGLTEEEAEERIISGFLK